MKTVEKTKSVSLVAYIIVALVTVIVAAATVFALLKIAAIKQLNFSGKMQYSYMDEIVEIQYEEADNTIIPFDPNSTEKRFVPTAKTTVNSKGLENHAFRLDVNCVLQNPDLPTGCEITSLATVLNFYGYDVSKTTLADKYLKKGKGAGTDFRKVFFGDPRSSGGFGCYAQPIVDAAEKYLTEQNSDYKVYNYSGKEFEELLKEVENGVPVIIWGTIDMERPYYTYEWIIDGEKVSWIAPEHCFVLIGYDFNRNVAIVCDPLKGVVEYNLITVKKRYNALFSQCVVIK